MSFIRTLTQENLICCGTQNCFSPSPAQTSIPMQVLCGSQGMCTINWTHYKVTLASLRCGTYPCCIIPCLYLHCMACPQVCDDFLRCDIKIDHDLPSARQCFALPRLYWRTWVWVWTWPYCRLAEVWRMLEQQECWNGDTEDYSEQILYIQRDTSLPQDGNFTRQQPGIADKGLWCRSLPGRPFTLTWQHRHRPCCL